MSTIGSLVKLLLSTLGTICNRLHIKLNKNFCLNYIIKKYRYPYMWALKSYSFTTKNKTKQNKHWNHDWLCKRQNENAMPPCLQDYKSASPLSSGKILCAEITTRQIFMWRHLQLKGKPNNINISKVLDSKLIVKKWQFNIRTIFPLESIQLWQYIQLLQTESQRVESVPYLWHR